MPTHYRGGKQPPAFAAMQALVFFLLLPLSFFLGVTFVLGHGRLLPFRGVWMDRLFFAAVVFGLPVAAAAVVGRLLRKDGGDRKEKQVDDAE